jgi:hypothetical protein
MNRRVQATKGQKAQQMPVAKGLHALSIINALDYGLRDKSLSKIEVTPATWSLIDFAQSRPLDSGPIEKQRFFW